MTFGSQQEQHFQTHQTNLIASDSEKFVRLKKKSRKKCVRLRMRINVEKAKLDMEKWTMKLKENFGRKIKPNKKKREKIKYRFWWYTLSSAIDFYIILSHRGFFFFGEFVFKTLHLSNKTCSWIKGIKKKSIKL